MARIGKPAFGVGALPDLRRRLRGDPAAFFRDARRRRDGGAQGAGARAGGGAAFPRAAAAHAVRRQAHRAPSRRRTRRSPTTARPPSTARGPPPTTSTPTSPRRARATRSRRWRSTNRFPGHHIQIAIAQELTGLPEFRKHAGVTAFVEGWGLYAEGLADELGLYKGARERLGRLNFDAWRASRLVVDTGIHAHGLEPIEQAIAFFEENAILAKDNIVNEVDRYIAWPGQALAYKLGEREIRAPARATPRSGWGRSST